MPSKTGIRDVKKRLRYIAGHLGGVERMIDAGRDPAEIHVQLRSLAAALQAVLQSLAASPVTAPPTRYSVPVGVRSERLPFEPP